MARYKYQGTFTDQAGNILDEGTISVFLAGGSTVATIYDADTGGSSSNSTTSNSSGYFEFWVDDGDYSSNQEFKITLSKSPFTPQTYDEIAIYPFASAGYVDTIKAADIISKSPRYDIRAYGAIGGGVVDDTVAIQAALDAANANLGGLVYVPAGLFQITASLTIGNATTLAGESKRSTIRAEDALEADMLINKDTSGGNIYIEVRDITLDGNRSGQTSTGGIIHFDNVNKLSIHDCWLLDAFNDALYIDNAFHVRIENNYAEGAGADSYTIHNTFDIIIDGNISFEAGQTGTGGGGITVITSNGRVIINANISKDASGTAGNGMAIQGTTNGVISNNICTGNAASGIETDTGNGRHSITGNQCIGNTARGLYVLNDENVISNNVSTGNGLHGISILSPGNRNIVSDNVFQNNTGEGIENAGSETTITGNICSSNDFSGIKNENADACVISGNVCRNNSQNGVGNYQGINIISSDYCIISGNRSIDTQGVSNTQAYSIKEQGTSDNNIVSNNIVSGGVTGELSIVGASTRVEQNEGGDETITTGSPTLQVWGSTSMDSSGGAITGTLGSGKYIGQTKTIVMTEASTSSTISITNHQTSDPEVATFDAIDETGIFMWTGTEWITIFATCTFV